jgi:diguanylate cyclase (GGDEF)-like protein
MAEAMNRTPQPATTETAATIELRRLQRQDFSLWVTAGIVMLLLVAANFIAADSHIERDPLARNDLDIALRSLAGLIFLFTLFIAHQQYRIRRLQSRLLQQAATIAATTRQAEHFQQVAWRDSLTGCYNRRFAEEQLPLEFARSRRRRSSSCVLMLDLNDFKALNDCYGHAVGDMALRLFSRRLRDAVRVSDVPIRFGGDEFVVFLPDCHTEDVPRLLQRIGTPLLRTRAGDIAVSYAAGWAEIRPSETLNNVLARADQAVYRCKAEMKREKTSDTIHVLEITPASEIQARGMEEQWASGQRHNG